jgi:hypothetical protein
MTALVHTLNERGFKTVRPSDEELHRSARKYLLETGYVLFGMLPSVIGQIIEHKVWKSRGIGFKNFGEYALSHTSNGLNINNNQKLWMLRCALDVTGKHVKEWAEVLEEVEAAVKTKAVADGTPLRHFHSNSLKQLAKLAPSRGERISYLPSENHTDGNLLRLRKNHPDLYGRVVAGKIKLRDAMREAGVERRDPVPIAISYVKRMDKKGHQTLRRMATIRRAYLIPDATAEILALLHRSRPRSARLAFPAVRCDQRDVGAVVAPNRRRLNSLDIQLAAPAWPAAFEGSWSRFGTMVGDLGEDHRSQHHQSLSRTEPGLCGRARAVNGMAPDGPESGLGDTGRSQARHRQREHTLGWPGGVQRRGQQISPGGVDQLSVPGRLYSLCRHAPPI